MPSIDLVKLRVQVRELAEWIDEPARFRDGLRRLMEGNAHRLLRRGRSMARRSALPAWEVPGIFLRELEAHLRPAAEADPSSALAAASAVWPGGRLEERILAGRLAALSGAPETLRPLLNLWLLGLEDPVLLGELATHFCRPFCLQDPTIFRADIRGWLESTAPAVRRFGWMILRRWLDEKPAQGLLAVFDLLPSALHETDPECIQLAADGLAQAARTAPAESARWLDDLPPDSFHSGRAFFQLALRSLPPDLSTAIRDRIAAA